ncbi:MAG: SDR family oxidoreductase [Candidatus Obscuribacterales bacterium]|nr:SDR family oxidoreductase [Candidatus Obscuribacterales bacterium]
MNTAMISGASRGIGRAIALELARKGWGLVLLSRSAGDLDRVGAEAGSAGAPKVMCLPCDILHSANIEESVKKVQESFNSLDLLVCNAGVGKFSPVLESTETDWEQMMNTNAKGSFMLSKAIAPLMVQKKSGQIIFIASDVARRTFPNGSIYCASKFAQFAFASALRQELRAQGVRVSVIMPGLVASEFNDGKADADEKADWLKPADVAAAVGYIVDAPSHVLVDEITLHPLSQEI